MTDKRDYLEISCARPRGYSAPSPFHNEKESQGFYKRLDQNRKLREECAAQYADRYVAAVAKEDIQIQLRDAADALVMSRYYTAAPPDLRGDIQHVTEDLVNGIDPSHVASIATGTVVGAITTIGIALNTYYRYVRALDPVFIKEPGYFGIIFPTVDLKPFLTTAVKKTIAGAAIAYVIGSIVYSYQHAGALPLPFYEVYRDMARCGCENATFGQNIGTDQKCFGRMMFDY